jgi:DNA-binding response OmpR family regulator
MASTKHVLLVEDEAAVRDLETRILEHAGYSVESVPDGAAAMKSLERRAPDLVLLDLNMPGVDGWRVLASIEDRDSPPPVVVVSGMYDAVPAGRLDGSVAAYVCKPFSVGELLAACEAALSADSVSPAYGNRKEARRNFRAESTVLDDKGRPVLRAFLMQVSRRGFRLELALPLEAGDPISVACHIPGRETPLVLQGRVRWRCDQSLGAELTEVSPRDRQLLEQLVGDD